MDIGAIAAIFGDLLFLIIIGTIFAIPILIPPLRRRARVNQGFRFGLILVCSLAAWIIPTLSLAYMGGVISTVFDQVSCGLSDGNSFDSYCAMPVDAELMDSFGHEMGYRAMMPPPLREHCFTGIPEVCKAADSWQTEATWTGYLLGWLIMSITGIVTAYLGWYLTRAVEKEKRKHGHLIGIN